jgi:hypothetical protein
LMELTFQVAIRMTSFRCGNGPLRPNSTGHDEGRNPRATVFLQKLRYCCEVTPILRRQIVAEDAPLLGIC